MENKTNQFEGLWIPVEILSNQNLSANEKLVLSIIKALDKGQGCFASNKYIAELIGLKSGTMSNMISDLHKKGFVEVTVEGHNTRTIKYIEPAGKQGEEPEEVSAEEETGEQHSKVIPMKSKPIMFKGFNIAEWDEEAIERLKRHYPEVIGLLERKQRRI